MKHPEQEKWSCESCPKTFNNYSDYVTHTDKHTEEDAEIERHDDEDDIKGDEDNDYKEIEQND
jgi:hypothetical protein